MTALEIAANAVMALSIGLAARNSVHTWPTGVLGCLLFAIVFVHTQLYADATLHGLPFVQDGTRRDDAFRLQQHAWYREWLSQLACPIFEAAGDVPERVSSVSRWLSTLDPR